MAIHSSVNNFVGDNNNDYVLALKRGTLVAKKRGFFTWLDALFSPASYNLANICKVVRSSGFATAELINKVRERVELYCQKHPETNKTALLGAQFFVYGPIHEESDLFAAADQVHVNQVQIDVLPADSANALRSLGTVVPEHNLQPGQWVTFTHSDTRPIEGLEPPYFVMAVDETPGDRRYELINEQGRFIDYCPRMRSLSDGIALPYGHTIKSFDENVLKTVLGNEKIDTIKKMAFEKLQGLVQSLGSKGLKALGNRWFDPSNSGKALSVDQAWSVFSKETRARIDESTGLTIPDVLLDMMEDYTKS